MKLNKSFLKYILTLAVVVVMFAACNENAKTGPETKPEAEKKSPVLATVNNKDITLEDYAVEASRLSPGERQALEDPENRQKFLETLVNKQVIVQDAEKKGVDRDPEVVKRLKPYKDEIVWRQYVKLEILDKTSVTDKDVKDYFEANKADLGSIRLSHILVGSREEAEAVLAKLGEGDDFEKLAKRISLDKNTLDKGGDLGYVSWLDFGSASLKDAAFKLKVGEVSSVVQSQFGYHVIKITDKKPAADADFDKLKDQVKELILEKKKEDAFDTLVKGLKDKSKVFISPDAGKEIEDAVNAAQQAAAAAAAK